MDWWPMVFSHKYPEELQRIRPDGPSDVTLICMQGHTPKAAPGVAGIASWACPSLASPSAIPHAYGESSVVLITVRMTLPIDFEYEWIRHGVGGGEVRTTLSHRRCLVSDRWHSKRRAAVWRWPWNWHFMIVQPPIMQPTGRVKVSLSFITWRFHMLLRVQFLNHRKSGESPCKSKCGLLMGLFTNAKSGSVAIKRNDSSDSLVNG